MVCDCVRVNWFVYKFKCLIRFSHSNFTIGVCVCSTRYSLDTFWIRFIVVALQHWQSFGSVCTLHEQHFVPTVCVSTIWIVPLFIPSSFTVEWTYKAHTQFLFEKLKNLFCGVFYCFIAKVIDIMSETSLSTSNQCAFCTKFGDLLCEGCGKTYCSEFCQMGDWRNHMRSCIKVP